MELNFCSITSLISHVRNGDGKILMSNNNPNPNPPRPAQPGQKPSFLRPPAGSLPGPAPARSFQRAVPPEEPTTEPWEETEAGESLPEPPARPVLRSTPALPPRPEPGQRPVARPNSAAPLGSPVAGTSFRSGASAENRPPLARQITIKPGSANPLRPGHLGNPSSPREAAPVARLTLPTPAQPAETAAPPALTRVEAPAVRPSAPVPAARARSIRLETPAPAETPELADLLERMANLPAQTAILGVCDDRLPVLLDLSDPAPGALLVASDDDLLRQRLLRTLLQTAAALNSPRAVQFLVLSSQPAEWRAWLEGIDAARHCLGIDSLDEGSPDRWLLKLSNWADQRRTGSSGPAVILVVDDLAAVPQMEYDARVNFDWLVKEGPGVRIWPVTSLAVEQAPELVRWVRLFKTRILGPAADPSLYRQLASVSEQESAALVDDTQFAVRIQDNWLKFHLPVQLDEKR